MADPTTTSTPVWYSHPGAQQDFLASSPEEAHKLFQTYSANKAATSLAGKVRPTTPPPQEPSDTRDFVGKMTDWLHGTAQQYLGQFGADLSTAVLPKNITQAATQGTLMAAGPLGVAAGKTAAVIGLPGLIAKALPFVTRMGLPAAVGATSEKLQGGDVTAGAMTGLAGSSISEAMGWSGSIASSFFNRISRMDSPALQRKQRDILGVPFTNTITSDIPSLAGKGGRVNFIDDIYKMMSPDKGRKYLGSLLDDAEKRIINTVGNTPVNIPAPALLISQGKDPTGFEAGIQEMTIERALDLRKKLTEAVFTKVAPGYSGVPIRQAAQDVQSKIIEAIPSPNLAKQYSALRDDYSKFMDLYGVFKSDKMTELFPPMPKGGPTFDPVRIYSLMMNNLDTISPQRFPNMHGFFKGKEPLGTGPTWEPAIPFLQGTRIAAGHGTRVIESIPKTPMMNFTPQMASHFPTPTGVTAGNALTRGAPYAAAMGVPTLESIINNRLYGDQQTPP